MKNFPWLIAIWIFYCISVYAQDTSRSSELERKILMTEDTDLEILAKGRKLLLTCINQDSLQKAAEVMSYLDSRFHSTRIMPFWQGEREIIALWIRHYDYLLTTENLEPQIDDGYRQKIVPPRDLIATELQQKAIRERAKFIAGIVSSNLADDEKQFVELLAATWIVDRSNQRKAQDSLNQTSDRFIYDHPHSRFASYVKKHIRFVYLPSKWSYGFDFSFGYTGLAGNISNFFDDAGTFAVGFDVSYNQFVFYPRFAVGFASQIKKNLFHPPGVQWNKDLKIQIFIPELTAGYMLIDNDFIRVAPFAGICGIMISPPENEKNRTGNNVELNSDASLLGGLNMDLRIGSMGVPFFSCNEKSDWTLKFRIAFVKPSYTGTNSAFSGSAIYFTVGVGGIGRILNRDE